MKYFLGVILWTLPVLALSNPPKVDFVTYLGGPYSAATRVAMDRVGYVYVAGITAYDAGFCRDAASSSSGVSYAFFTKLQPHGDAAVWTICMPGTAAALALDDAGFVYASVSAYGLATILKLDANDARSIFTTTIKSATASSIALDRAGNIYVAGSATDGLPTTPGAAQPNFSCSKTCSFVAKLNRTGEVQYVTYAESGGANSLAVDSQGAAWITGTMEFYSMAEYSGFYRSFIEKLDASGSRILFSTQFGGGGYFHVPVSGYGLGIAVDSTDSVVAVGQAGLPLSATPGPLGPPSIGGSSAGYFMKLDSAGKVLYSKNAYMRIGAVTVDAEGNAYLSMDGNLEQTLGSERCGGGNQTPNASTLVALSPDASRVLGSCIVSGRINGIALNGAGGVSAVGETATRILFPTPGAYISHFPGTGFGAAFAARADFSQPAGPQLFSLVNAGNMTAGRNSSGADGSVAPGELVTLFGRGFVPGAGLSVTFDDTPAPILYSDTGQINAVVPFGVGKNGKATLVAVHHAAQTVGPYQFPIAIAAPGLFSVTAGGTTQVAALNQDGSLNSSTNPAARGSVVSVFLTGAGAYDLNMRDGDLGPLNPPYPAPLLGFGASVWTDSPGPHWPGEPAQILFVGQAPTLVAGVVQVNLRIPDDIPAGRANVIIHVGDYSTYAGSRPDYIEVR